MSQRILIVEDDPKAAELVRLYLEREGHQVMVAHDGRLGLDLARTRQPDLIVLDLMLPGISGVEICRTLRAETPPPGIPIIMLTARSTEDDKLLGLDLGADDYVTKPFSPRELAARVRSILRRAGSGGEPGPESLTFGPLSIHLWRHEVTLHGEPIRLTRKEYDLLTTLAKDAGRAFSRAELVEKAFGYDYDGLERTVDVHILKLRKKIEADVGQPRYLQTIYGYGYRFAAEAGSAPDA